MNYFSCRIFLVGVLAVVVALLPALGAAQTGGSPRKPAPSGDTKPAPVKPRAAEGPSKKSREGEQGQPVVVDADRMESFKKEGLVIFTGNVVARQDNSVQYADRMEVYLDERGDQVVRAVSTGNVRVITKDCRIGTARRGEYDDLEKRVVLIGNARVWQDDNVVTGERITIYLAEDRSIVESGKQERVKAVFHPKSDEQRKGAEGGGARTCP